MQLKSFSQNEIVSFFSSNAHGKFISYNVDKISFILFNTSNALFLQFKASIIYYFHA